MTRADSPGIVVIGASRGGIKALSCLLRSLSHEFPVGVATVLHTGSHSPRLLDRILTQRSSVPVSYAAQREHLWAGHVYLAPPDFHLIVADRGILGLTDGPKVRHSRPAADRLFESAAEIYGKRVIGVVLTGGDGDGTAGLNAIHAAGGIAIVQDPQDAEDRGMPESALAGGSPDYCVRIKDMGELLNTLSLNLLTNHSV
jgi:two-component system chemotaxis response regulator CheB